MIANLFGITGITVSILLFVLFVIGLIYSKIHSFKLGVFFFLLLIVHEVYSFVSPPLIRNYVDNLENSEPLVGMTIGEFVAFLSLIPEILIFTAFLFLIIGLRKFRNTKQASTK